MPKLIRQPSGLISVEEWETPDGRYYKAYYEDEAHIKAESIQPATFEEIRDALKEFLDIEVGKKTPSVIIEYIARRFLCHVKHKHFASCSGATPYHVAKLKVNAQNLNFKL